MKHTVLISFLLVLLSLSAETGLSGAGRVRKIETEHTTIIYEPADRESALTVASFADETYEQLAGLVGYTEMKRVPVVLFSGSSTANGMYSSMPSRITMYITSDPELFLTSRSSWLYSLYVHELTHFLHLTQQVGPASFLTPVFGPDVPMMNTPLMPGWWIEGITTYTETVYAPGGRGTSSRFLMPVREDPSILPLSKTSYASNRPPRLRIYLGGNILVSYLMETYGEDIYRKINSEFAWFPFFGMGHSVKKVTGESLKDIYERALQRIGAPVAESPHPLITREEGMHDLIGMYGDTLYLQRWDHSHGLSLLAYREGELKTVSSMISGIADDVMALCGDASSAYLLFRRSEPYNPSPIYPGKVSYSDLYRYDLSTQDYTPLSVGSVLRQVTVSPDTGTIAAVEAVDDRYRLVSVSPDTYQVQSLYDVPGSSFLFPSYAPKGNSIAGVIVSGGTSSLVLLQDSQTEVLIEPVSHEIRDVRFVNEHTVSFTSDRDAPFSLYTHDLNTGLTTRVLRDASGILDAVISADDIYYKRYAGGWTGIFHATRDPAQEETVTFGRAAVSLPYRRGNTTAYEEKAFYDLLRFNLWFPYPITVDGVYGAGAYSLFTSILQRHSLLVMAGYTFGDQSVRASGEYRYSPGQFTLTLQGDIESGDLDSGISGSLSIPLVSSTRPKGQQLLYVQGSGSYRFASEDTVASAGLSYSFNGPSALKDAFGRYAFGTSYSMNVYDGSVFLSYGTLQAYTPSFVRHHSISHRLRGITTPGTLFSEFTDPRNLLAPESFRVPAQDGYARVDYTLSYRIPLAVADIPFLYGGFTSAYLTFAARGAGVYDGSSFSFEDDVILTAQAGANYSLGIGFLLNPYVSLEWAPISGEWGVTVAVGTDSFLSTLPSTPSVSPFSFTNNRLELL